MKSRIQDLTADELWEMLKDLPVPAGDLQLFGEQRESYDEFVVALERTTRVTWGDLAVRLDCSAHCMPENVAYIMPGLDGFPLLPGEDVNQQRLRHIKEHPEMYGKIVMGETGQDPGQPQKQDEVVGAEQPTETIE